MEENRKRGLPLDHNQQIQQPLEAIKLENAKELADTVEAFQLLNPDSSVIIFADADSIETEVLMELKQNTLNHCYLITDSNDLEQQLSQIVNPLEKVTKNQIQEEKIIEETTPAVPEEVKPLPVEQTEKESVSLTPDVIYKKAKKRNKISEGEPLSKCLKVMPAGKTDPPSNVTMFSQYSEQGTVKRKLKKWNCSNVMVGIWGTDRRVGTTVAAIHLAIYLNNLGAKVTYTEANNHNHLAQIASAYRFNCKEQYYMNNGISYFINTQFDPDGGANFILFDLGSIQENTVQNLKIAQNAMNEVIIIAGGKPHEQAALKNMLQLMKSKLTILCNLVSDAEFMKMKSLYQTDEIKLFRMGYVPELLEPGIWEDEITGIFESYSFRSFQNQNA